MKDCERSYSSWKFSGGFRTWVKMSLVKTKEEDGRETVEFKQEVSKQRKKSVKMLGVLRDLKTGCYQRVECFWSQLANRPALGADSNVSWRKGWVRWLVV